MREKRTGFMLPFKSTVVLLAFLAAAGCKKAQAPADEAQQANKTPVANLQTLSTGLIVGINGHPLNTVAYNANSSTIAGVDYTTQSAMVKAMNMTYYRVDVATDANGKATNEAKLLDIIAKCQVNNIKVLPMIYDRCNYSGTTTSNYNAAYTQMAGFATLYGQYFDYFELGNEWELFDDLLLSGTGQSQSNYDMPKVLLAEQYVKGMENGLKSVLPSKQSIVNTAGYLPTFWMDRMYAAAPSINICGWHLYADMPPAYLANLGISNIHQYLWNRYHRPIWYTESGYRFKTTYTQQQNEDASNTWRTTLTQDATADPNVKAIIFYELLDEPERSGFSPYNFQEENFGWVKFNGYPGKTNQTTWNTWKADPNRYQNWSYKTPAAELVGPDLIVTDITWAPSSPHTGNSVVFTVTVKNVGVAATPAGTILGVSFKVDGNSAGCNGTSTASLAPGATRILTANGCSPSSWTAIVGTHSVVAMVDDQSRIRESDETNNTRTESVTVTN
ncbi:MAG: CARDB domain-containing protein [Mucilaginibacter sp.]|uniref:CARDB domain-containing protein n=1 Tax=Mucilaginibacter sp. TaxID=1882438 RepID=UPI00326308C3